MVHIQISVRRGHDKYYIKCYKLSKQEYYYVFNSSAL